MSVNPKSRSPGRPRSEACREAALRAAIELLDELGFAGLSIDGIAARAGIGKRTIYRWWSTKGAVVIEAFLTQISPRIVFPVTNNPVEDLIAQLRSVVAAYIGKDGRTVQQLLALGQADEHVLKAFAEGYIEPRRQAAREALYRILGADTVDRIDIEEVIDSIYGPIFYRLLVQHRELDEDFIERHVRIYLSGLSKEIMPES
ncbi:TetR family transcriptional regulator [Pantoea alhagi]|uniref:TetR family transcriptional regulator n=1 Tax=Pantoea alhagi TaxID=1891675 RepID=A0A1W6B764_9GAMM|nr:TetR/AcrR family transcriptional regulator [Pantoea alhagi]ARJ42940.1 TetR family transcriptional regulator [Pantoea alhagi]